MSATPQPRVRTPLAVHSPIPGSSRSSASASSSGSPRSRSVSSRPSSAARASPWSRSTLTAATPGHLGQREELLRPRERPDGPLLPVELHLDRVAGLLRQPLLDPPRLGHRDPLADHERRRGLVGREEADRAEQPVARLQRADDRVPPADLRPAACRRGRATASARPGARPSSRSPSPKTSPWIVAVGSCRTWTAALAAQPSTGNVMRIEPSAVGRAPDARPGSRRRSRGPWRGRTVRAAGS